MLNCGLDDDWVEMCNNDLKNKHLCSRYFSKDSFHALGRLLDNVMPKIANSFSENSDSETGTDVGDDNILLKRKSNDLEQRLIETQAQLQQNK